MRARIVTYITHTDTLLYPHISQKISPQNFNHIATVIAILKFKVTALIEFFMKTVTIIKDYALQNAILDLHIM